jgi:hypothetical protein
MACYAAFLIPFCYLFDGNPAPKACPIHVGYGTGLLFDKVCIRCLLRNAWGSAGVLFLKSFHAVRWTSLNTGSAMYLVLDDM